MISISLTDFIDYVSKIGASKYTLVSKINSRDEYQPAFDFWKSLREGIINLHKNNEEKEKLDLIILDLTDKKKLNRYPELITKYKSFLGRKTIEWFDPPYREWEKDDLRVRLNPELGLDINGKYYAIKLYFKAEKLSQIKADLILLLMNNELKKKDFKNVNFAILDIGSKKLFEKTKLNKSHIPLLEGEALSFINIWKSLNIAD